MFSQEKHGIIGELLNSDEAKPLEVAEARQFKYGHVS